MSTIALLADPDVTPDTAAIFREAKARMGKVPNLLRVMAQAPAVLDVYWDGRGALGQGVLPAKVQQQIAIAVAAANGCDYCLAAHTGAGRAAGLSAVDLADAQRGEASDGHAAAILALALDVNAAHGRAGPDILDQARAAGLNTPRYWRRSPMSRSASSPTASTISSAPASISRASHASERSAPDPETPDPEH